MSDRYRGPLAWLRRWNFRRVERRRWRRELLEALAEDDAAIMESLARLLEQGRAQAGAREEGLALLEQRLEEVVAGLGARLDGLGAGLGARLDGLGAELGARLAAARREAGGDGTAPAAFPAVATSRPELLEPELELLSHLAPSLSPRLAVDVGAHLGRFSRRLLDLGFEVHALEPNPEVRAELLRRLGGRAGLTVHAVAAGAEDGEADLRLVADPAGAYSDPSQFGNLSALPLPPGLVHAGTVRVPLRRLDGLLREAGPAAPSVVKIDAEGCDLDVLRGLGELRPGLLVVEFWDGELPFSGPGARNRLPDLAAHARAHGARWHLVIFRRWGDDRAAFYASYPASVERSWGNVLFFRDRELFEEARRHLATLLPEARFVPAPPA